MKASIYILIVVGLMAWLITPESHAQGLYFPPSQGTVWDTTSPQQLGWCQAGIDSTYDYLARTNTKAFIVLKDGKIVLEKYFGTFGPDSVWYWASAGKTLTGLAIGLAQQENKLRISQRTSDFLGTSWTATTAAQEAQITIRHQLTMTTGLDDAVQPEPACTLPACLIYRANAGARWAYHNAPYTLLDDVVKSATGSNNLTLYLLNRLRPTTGFAGIFIRSGYNNVFYSTPRNMARFGLLMLNKGTWGNTAILTDTAYFMQSVTTSQSFNQSYGYLWWLNGKSSYRVPQSQVQISGSLIPDGPADIYAAIGKNGQLINISPSERLVMIRMGEVSGNNLVPFTYNNEIWQRLRQALCTTQLNQAEVAKPLRLAVIYDPTTTNAIIQHQAIGPTKWVVLNQFGQQMATGLANNSIEVACQNWPTGVYFVQVGNKVIRFLKY